jgi:Arc/MetJ-type ribon-helix-helix transcriptional regulator
MTDEYSVSVPADLYKQCERNIENTTFESVDQYVRFILSEVLERENSPSSETDDSHDVAKEQLEALGYLDQ